MIIQLTKKQMKELKTNYVYFVDGSAKDGHKFAIQVIGNTFYYANKYGCRVRVQECFALSEFNTIYGVLFIHQDYEGIFSKD